MTAAEQMIQCANTDDALTHEVTIVDGVDLTTVVEIVSDERLDGWRADPMVALASGERRKIVCRTADGRRHTFYWAVEGSPDGIWSHMSKDRHDPLFMGAFA